ncbi:MAG: IS1182 family transposase [Candidatus Omnitrophota bacterium]
MAYITGDRYQMTLLPKSIEDYISQDDPVRAYDAFVEALDFDQLGITIDENKTGANPYWPKAMVKLLVYGYPYGTRSSRKLERACHHNLSFIWLTGGLKPDYRTIARFRSDNKEALKKILQQCVKMCIKFDLIEGNTLFVDGTKIKANASLKNTWSQKDCREYLEKISKNIEEIITESERLDQQEGNVGSLVKLKEELRNKQTLAEQVKEIADELKRTSKTYVNTTDPDSIKTKGDRGSKMYHNSQIVVDVKHGLVVEAEAVPSAFDINQLNRGVQAAQDTLGKPPKTVCADAGYHSSADIEKIDPAVTVVVPSQTQVIKERTPEKIKPFSKDKFRYDSDADRYLCPAGNTLIRTNLPVFEKKDRTAYKAKSSDCKQCTHFGVCTTSAIGRKIVRLNREPLLQQLAQTYASDTGQWIYKLRK